MSIVERLKESGEGTLLLVDQREACEAFRFYRVFTLRSLEGLAQDGSYLTGNFTGIEIEGNRMHVVDTNSDSGFLVEDHDRFRVQTAVGFDDVLKYALKENLDWDRRYQPNRLLGTVGQTPGEPKLSFELPFKH